MSATPLKKIGLNELTPMIVALSDAGGTTEHAEWIRKPGNAGRIIGFINQWLEINIGAFFFAPIVYIQPEFEELKRRFLAYVNPEYKAKHFDPIERCKSVPTNVGNREIAFEYVYLDRNASTDEVLAEMDRKGLRPALYEELLGFALKYPDEQRKHPIVALGSEALVDGNRYVAYLWDDGHGPRLNLAWFDYDWHERYRFLAVREAA